MTEILNRIKEAANNKKNASEFTHGIYRYPASMSPILAREIILSFTKKNDIILDPFCGGGTTAIESILHGRKIICSDINSLASFITRTKATPLKEEVINKINEWSILTLERLEEYRKMEVPANFQINDNLHCRKTTWILEKLKDEVNLQTDHQIRSIGNLILLSVGKKCYDCQDKPLNPYGLIKSFDKISHLTIKSLAEYSTQCFNASSKINLEDDIKIFCENALNLPNLIENNYVKKIKLVLTSPPYPGVHILYHRWQIKGRRQSSLPFNLLNLNDGSPSSYYTLGAKTKKGYEFYFESINKIFLGLSEIISKNTIVVQVVSFTEPKWQLTKYLEAMDKAGYNEIYLNSNKKEIITREVPNRKWYTNLNDRKTIEYILFHRIK
jgi:DNA modification methylase